MADNIANGTYIIINRVLSPQGQRLAMTFNGANQAVTGTPVGAQNNNQQWAITRFGAGVLGASTYELKPVSSQNLETGQGSGNIVTLPIGGYIFSIYKDDFGYIVQDSNRHNTWALENATAGSRVVFPGSLGDRQRWYFHNIADGVLPA
ncbi:hypothetical protein RSOLAG22IIIB_11581 [Rhizoctonia solani]|uniref:CCL2-like lectin domain-containing protein n=1 Tax=Rhizoctonia solani TaxID=456999 RepID=A0A0K6G9T4_9AGAM|nr:hypothetical protein RSOLAG22IIIB_11581 [Rhizoctonia solani]